MSKLTLRASSLAQSHARSPPPPPLSFEKRSLDRGYLCYMLYTEMVLSYWRCGLVSWHLVYSPKEYFHLSLCPLYWDQTLRLFCVHMLFEYTTTQYDAVYTMLIVCLVDAVTTHYSPECFPSTKDSAWVRQMTNVSTCGQLVHPEFPQWTNGHSFSCRQDKFRIS